MASFWPTEIWLLRIILSVLHRMVSLLFLRHLPTPTLSLAYRGSQVDAPDWTGANWDKGLDAMPGVLVLQFYWQRWSTKETHKLSHWGQIWIFISDGLLKHKELLYLLLELPQWADFCSLEHHGNIVGIPCCLDPGQLILHQDNIHTYRQKAEGLQQYLTSPAQ